MIVYMCLFSLLVLLVPIYHRQPKLYVWLNVAAMCLISCLRNVTVGADTISYQKIFYAASKMKLPTNIVGWFVPIHDQRFEAGFILYNKLVHSFTHNFQWVIIISSIIVALGLGYFLTNIDINYPIALGMFIGLNFYASTLNTMRQGIAWSLCLVAFIMLQKERNKAFFLFVLLAAEFHMTAWTFLIIYILRMIRLTWKLVLGFVTGSGVALASFEIVYSYLARYSAELSSFSIGTKTSGINLLLNISICVVLLLWSYRVELYKQENTQVLLWMLLIVILINAVAFKFTQLSRIALYFSVAEIIVFPQLVEKIRAEKIRKYIKFASMVMLVAFFIVVQLIRPEWYGIIPYAFFWQI